MELTKIADWLLLNGTLTKCPGLLHGKLGIAIFFFHYARYTGKTLFEEYAWEFDHGNPRTAPCKLSSRL